MSTWTNLSLQVQNLCAGPVQARLSVTLVGATPRPEQASGGTCLGASQPPAPSVVDCELSLDGAAAGSLAFPVRWNGPGVRTVDVQASLVSPAASRPDVTASARVSVYTLVLHNLTTSPSPIRAGRAYIATASLARSDTGEPLAARSLRCLAVTAVVPKSRPSPLLRAASSRHGSRLRCSWRVPAVAAGRYVQALMLADTHPGGMQTKYPFWRRIVS
jgi:hypothetical protein